MQTDNLTLLPATIDHLEALIAGDHVFRGQFGHAVAAGYLDFPDALPFSLEALRKGAVESEWWTYLIVLRGNNTLIGIGGYKGAPTEGVAEIGYCIAPGYRGQGYATEAAGALVRRAFARPEVRVVRAHTLAELNASNRVLAKLGLIKVDAVRDPREGDIWRWEIEKP